MAALTPEDAVAAAERMRNVLKTRVDGDYDAQTVLGDLVVDAHAILFADLNARIADLRQRQSLRDLRLAPSGADTDDAADALLSNLVINRDAGTFARGTVTVHFSTRADTLVSRNTRFFRTRAHVFYLNAIADQFVAASAMRPTYDARGAVVTWACDLPVIAARTGVGYNATPGRFQAVDPFSPYLVYAENSSELAGGLDLETAASAIARTPTALSLRALVNDRSNDARLREAFAEVSEVLTIGAGDPEMARDLVPGVRRTHALGHVDIYVRLPLHRVTARLIVGASGVRADRRVLTFRDSAVSFLTAGVREGDVLVVAAGLVDAPMHFRVASVRANEIDVVRSAPFSEATDERVTPPSLTYSIGDNYPTFDNRIAFSTSATAATSRSISQAGCVVLPAAPIYAIVSVEVPSPPAALAPFSNVVTGVTYYTSRRSTPWARSPLPGEQLSYRVLVDNPAESQSIRAVTLLELGWPGEPLTGTEVLVTYETLVSYAAVAELAMGRSERPLASNILVRAHHPVYVSCTIPYKPRTTRTTQGVDEVAAVNETAVTSAVIEYIETAPPEDLDASSVGGVAARADANVKHTLPFELNYELILPDGRIAKYSTPDAVDLAPSDESNARLNNYAELGLPTDYKPALRRLFNELGVSDRVVRYRANVEAVSLERR